MPDRRVPEPGEHLNNGGPRVIGMLVPAELNPNAKQTKPLKKSLDKVLRQKTVDSPLSLALSARARSRLVGTLLPGRGAFGAAGAVLGGPLAFLEA